MHIERHFGSFGRPSLFESFLFPKPKQLGAPAQLHYRLRYPDARY
jgi:hypothetical protein